MTVNYGSGGSGKGRSDLASGVVNFAASDSPDPRLRAVDLQGQDGAVLPRRPRPGHGLVQPVRRQQALQLSAPVIANIFNAKITTWNNPAITAATQGSPCPAPRSPSPSARIPRARRRTSPCSSRWPRGRVDTWHQLHHQVARHGPRRQRQRRGSIDHQVHPRRHRVRGLLRRQGLRAVVRLGQEHRRRLRRAVAVVGIRGRERVTIASNLTFHAVGDRTPRRTRSPISRGSWSSRRSRTRTTRPCSRRRSATCSDAASNCSGNLGFAPLPSSLQQMAQRSSAR